jgi:hypothetical protein
MNVSGLSTDIFFIAAIKSNEELMELLPAHDVYNNVADPDFDMDNVAMPYIIVNNDGGNNDTSSKDNDYESENDKVNISVRIVARNRKELDNLASTVRQTIHQYICDMDDQLSAGEEPEGWELKPEDYTFSFSDIAYEMQKPSHYVMFYYQCDVTNDLI